MRGTSSRRQAHEAGPGRRAAGLLALIGAAATALVLAAPAGAVVTTVDAPAVNGYLEVDRVWKAGDTVALDFSMDVQVSRLPDNPDVVAFTYGPIVLSAGLGTERMESEPQWASEKATIPDDLEIKDNIVINSGSIEDWLADISDTELVLYGP